MVWMQNRNYLLDSIWASRYFKIFQFVHWLSIIKFRPSLSSTISSDLVLEQLIPLYLTQKFRHGMPLFLHVHFLVLQSPLQPHFRNLSNFSGAISALVPIGLKPSLSSQSHPYDAGSRLEELVLQRQFCSVWSDPNCPIKTVQSLLSQYPSLLVVALKLNCAYTEPYYESHIWNKPRLCSRTQWYTCYLSFSRVCCKLECSDPSDAWPLWRYLWRIYSRKRHWLYIPRLY